MDEYKIIQKQHSIENLDASRVVADVSALRTNRKFSAYTLTAEIARYLQTISPILINQILRDSDDGIAKLVAKVNEANDVLYKYIIPKLFGELYEITEFETNDELELDLVKDPSEHGENYYTVTYKEGLTASMNDGRFARFKDKSFNVDNYVFDSNPEYNLFWTLLHDHLIDKVWFTGMLTHGQSDFYINYIDPESGGVRSYYPDFITLNSDGTYTIIEVKGDNKLDDPIVQAKAYYANQIAKASGMKYVIIPGSDAARGVGLHENLPENLVQELKAYIEEQARANSQINIHIYESGAIHDDNSTNISFNPPQ